MKDFKEADYQSDDTLAIFGFSRGAALARKFASMILEEHPQCRVSFLGVFDTVAAMGGMHRKGERISSHVVFENGTLNERIERAVYVSDNDAPSRNTDDLPIVHYSVKERFHSVSGYRPAALRGRIFKLLRDGKISEPLHGISQLRGEVQFPS